MPSTARSSSNSPRNSINSTSTRKNKPFSHLLPICSLKKQKANEEKKTIFSLSHPQHKLKHKTNSRDEEEWTLLFHAVFNNRLEAARILIERGSQVNLVDALGRSPLYLAAGWADDTGNMVKLLLDHGASHKPLTSDGSSPLFVFSSFFFSFFPPRSNSPPNHTAMSLLSETKLKPLRSFVRLVLMYSSFVSPPTFFFFSFV